MPGQDQPRVLEIGERNTVLEPLRSRGFSIRHASKAWLDGASLACLPHKVAIINGAHDVGGAVDVGRAMREVRPELGIVLMKPVWNPVERHQLMAEFADACLETTVDIDDLAGIVIALDRRASAAAARSCCLRWGSLQIDFIAGAMAINGTEITLQPLQLRILACLIEHSGSVVTCEQLQREVFRARVSATSIPRQISVLRRHLEPFGAKIWTLRGGYGMGISDPSQPGPW